MLGGFPGTFGSPVVPFVGVPSKDKPGAERRHLGEIWGWCFQEVIVLQELSALLAPRRVLAAAGSLRGQQEEQQRQEASG